MTIHDATKAIGCRSENYVRRLIRAGTLSARLIDGRYDVDPASVKDYIASRRSISGPEPPDVLLELLEKGAAL